VDNPEKQRPSVGMGRLFSFVQRGRVVETSLDPELVLGGQMVTRVVRPGDPGRGER